MREDMSKVVVERPRYGHSNKKARKKPDRDIARTQEDLPEKENIKSRWKDKKSPSDFLSPLKRYLHTKIGSPWNEVYSEIRSRISSGSTMQLHILEHVDGMVLKNVIVDDKTGIVRRVTDTRPVNYYVGGRGWRTLYVHPVSGLLQEVKPIKEVQEISVTTLIIPGPYIQYRLINKNWYVLELAKCPEPVKVKQLNADKTPALDRNGKEVFRVVHPGYDQFIESSLEPYSFSLRGFKLPYFLKNKEKALTYYYGKPNLYCKRLYPVNRKDIKIIKKTIGTEQYDQSIKL